jgi:hypothetical protein
MTDKKLRFTGMEIPLPKNTEEAHEIGKKLSRKEILARWKEYNRSLSKFSPSGEERLRRAFREQMLRETVEGYLGVIGHHSLTRDHIEMLLKKRRGYGTNQIKG